VPDALGVTLPELNLRTYVTCDGVPGVYFFSLDAEGLAGVAGARLFHHLPYYYARISLDPADDGVWFSSRRFEPGARPARFEATYRPTGARFESRSNPLAEFLLERYRFYTEGTDGSLRYSTVSHEPWTLRPATATVETRSLLRANGFHKPDVGAVYLYSQSVDVSASRSKRVR